MLRPLLAAAGLWALAGAALAQQTRACCDGRVEASASFRPAGAGVLGGGSVFQYWLSPTEAAHLPGRVVFAPAQGVAVPEIVLRGAVRREVLVGSEPRTSGQPPGLSRERILDFATIACAPG